jgi:hypothetical protein
MVTCELDGRGSQGVEHTTTGPGSSAPIGVLARIDDFPKPAKGREVFRSLRSCRLVVAPERRGSSKRSYTANHPGLVNVRFR